MKVANVAKAAKGNGSIEELQGEVDEQVVKERGKEKPEDKENGKEEAEAAYPGEKGVQNYHANKESRLQKLKDLTETWDGKEMDVKREKENDSCRDRSEKETNSHKDYWRKGGEEIHNDKKEICKER
ncbi:hypothetical protein K435DRAFT_796596 [Dendrothele bispora CBS 962.96]|uniref:Uncharacterized protein n=1 Tax=Dendrothele bispora (strain CBS 962.96) TaxID=1314807 RepID=A0A4S8M6A4_DENBC|nr:hypothetical protein K435DRAFT_796596 [Dendrothele bispora CBS 962.96]